MYDDDYDYGYCGYDDDDNDYERDTFYALTDGMYGDYDEWRENGGSIDDLMDALGYSKHHLPSRGLRYRRMNLQYWRPD